MAKTLPQPGRPGLIPGIISCVCCVLGWLNIHLMVFPVIVGTVLGAIAIIAGKPTNYVPSIVLGIFGALINVFSFIFVLIVGFYIAGLGVGGR